MRTFTLDSFLALLRGTVLHPVVSLLLPCGLILTGHEPNPIQLGSDLQSMRWISPTSSGLRWALWCVAASWILAINRTWSRRAMNPAPSFKPDFSKEIVVVTGGSTGIGAILVRKLEAAGATIIVLDVAPLSYKAGRRTTFIKCNIGSSDDVRAAASAIIRQHGSPTMLVANAGIVRGKTLLEASDDDLRLTFDVNVFGLLWSIRAFLPGMISMNRGHVLVTASATAFMTVAGMADYSASKAAVTSLCEGLHTELKHKHGNPSVAVSAIFPATIATKMFKDLDSPDTFLAPMLEPEDVAQRMFDILASGQSENAYLPAFSTAQPWFRVLPTWMRIGMQDVGCRAADKMGGKHAGK